MRSSVLPVARMRFVVGWEGVEAVGGEMARLEMEELWAWKRKVSVKVTSVGLEEVAVCGGGKVAVSAWRTRS